MATGIADSCAQQIGEVAGLVWKVLDTDGPMSLAKLAKSIDAPRDLVMQGVGWLAREEKVELEESSRGRVITLT